MFKMNFNNSIAYLSLVTLGYPLLMKSSWLWSWDIGILCALFGIVVLVFGLLIFVDKWEKREKTSYRVLEYYVEIFVFYSIAYTFAVVVAPDGSFLEGLNPILGENISYTNADLAEVYQSILLLFFDAVTFSISIMTTLGDGTVEAKNILKTVVASQVAFTFLITVYGIAETFSNKSSNEIQMMRKQIELSLNKHPETSNKLINCWCKKAPFRKRVLIGFKYIVCGKCE
jgi:hypothetical protein